MSEPFLAEIRIVGFNFAPRGWAFCDGQILPINQNQSLYSLLGTTYGGDGRTSFALPDLRGRTALHRGRADTPVHSLGAKGGTESETLGTAQLPAHTHELQGTTDAGVAPDPVGRLPGPTAGGRRPLTPYTDPANLVALRADSIDSIGGQPHDNMQPWLALNFCIALQGLYPSRN